MKRSFLLMALVVSVMVTTAPALADGDFYGVAVGGGVGTKITNLPYEIITPGFYYLGGNLTATSGTGITVKSDNVTLDLMGFCLSGNSANSGIYLNSGISGIKNVEIRNGTLCSWNTGIAALNPAGAKHRIINIRAEGNTNSGINLYGKGHIVKGCTLSDNPASGIRIEGGTISGNVADNCGTGITCAGEGIVIGNTLTCNTGQTGIYLSTKTSDPIMLDQNTVNGSGTHYSGGTTTATVWAGKSALYPYGNNAGAP
jgi:hypothetical protein